MEKGMLQFGVLYVMLISVLSTNAGVIFSDDFSTDPFDTSSPRWEITYQQDSGSKPVWQSADENVKFIGKQSNMRTTGDFVLTTQQAGCYNQTDFMFTDAYNGSWIKLVAMLQSDGDGYKLGIFNHGSYNRTEWTKDSRLTKVAGDSVMSLLEADKWYILKVEMLDDSVNDKTVVRGYVYDKATSTLISSITLEDSSSSRLKTHQNMEIQVYPGNGGGNTGAFVDNAVATPEPATIGLMAIGFAGLLRKK